MRRLTEWLNHEEQSKDAMATKAARPAAVGGPDAPARQERVASAVDRHVPTVSTHRSAREAGRSSGIRLRGLRFFVAASCAVFVVQASVLAENWPQWRGPALNGISSEKNLPVKWSPTENVAWKVAVPQYSGSTPIIWGEHIFLNVADKGELHLWALDRSSGATRWTKKLSGGDRRQMKQNMSSPSPVTDGRHVWVMTGTGFLTAFDFAGNQVWQRDIQKDYGMFGIMHGYAASPLLHEGALYVPVLHGMMTDDPSYILKIDKASGKTIWRQERPTRARFESPDAYTTPALLRVAGREEIVITGGDVVTGHDPANGQELWRADGLNPSDEGNYRIVASPVVHGDLLFTPSRERPLLSIRPGGKGDITKSHVLWSFNNGPDVPTPVTDGTYLYSINDRGIMYVLEARTGKTVYGPQRLRSATYSSSPVLADGKIYITDEDGVTSVVSAGPKFEVLAENDLGQYTLSSAAISEGQIFLRTDGFLFAIGQRRK